MLGAEVVILYSTQAARLIQNWLEVTMGHAKGSNWWYRSGMMCACDCKVLIGYQSNSSQEWHMTGIMVQQGSSEGSCSPSQNRRLLFMCLSQTMTVFFFKQSKQAKKTRNRTHRFLHLHIGDVFLKINVGFTWKYIR